MNYGLNIGRAKETPFGRISDLSLRVGKYHVHMLMLLAMAMFGKGFNVIGLFAVVMTLVAYYQSPIMRFLAWRKRWFKIYFYLHFFISVVAGILLSPSHEHAGIFGSLIFINIIFVMGMMIGFSSDFNDLLNGEIDFEGRSQ